MRRQACLILTLGLAACAEQSLPGAATPLITNMTSRQVGKQSNGTEQDRVSTATVPISRPSTMPVGQAVSQTFSGIDGPAPLQANLGVAAPLEVDTYIQAAAGDVETQKTLRNEFVGSTIAASDQKCDTYIRGLTRTDRTNNVLFSSLTTILGGLGAIFIPANTARALSGAAGISSGLQGDVNTSVFYGQTMQTIAKAIETQRASDIVLITASYGEPYSTTTYSQVYPEIQNYHNKCSLYAAFAAINTALARGSDDPGAAIKARYDSLTAAAKSVQDYRDATRKLAPAPALAP